MSYKLNVFTGQLDEVGSSNSSPTSIAIGTPITGASANSVLVTDSSSTIQDIGSLANGQLVIGSTGNKPVAGSLTGTANQISVSPGSGSITLSLPQNIATTSSPTFTLVAANLDKSGTLDIGATNATTINIGSSTSSVNVFNALNLNTHKLTNVVDPTSAQDGATKNYVDTSIAAAGVTTANKQVITLSSTDITNQYVDLSVVVIVNTVALFRLGVEQREGFDYSVSLTGGAGGNSRISFLVGGDLASTAGNPLVAGDSIEVTSLSSTGIISGGAVTSVNGRNGAVTLTKSDVSLSNVDNTSDLNKPISTATQAALNLKADITTSIVNALIYG